MSAPGRRRGSTAGEPPVLALEDVAVSVPDVRSTGAPESRRVILQGVSLSVQPGEAVGLVGPSGIGKTLLTRAALGLLPPGVRLEPPSSIRIEGEEMVGAPEARWRDVRGSRVGAVFQSPGAALTPVRTIGAQLGEVLRCHGMDEGRADPLLAEVGLDARAVSDRAPHELSGGMRQRALLALALAPDPELLIADEPTAALDVTTEARIIELLGTLQRRRRLALLVVSHDPLVVHRLCTRRVHLAPRPGKGPAAPAYSHSEGEAAEVVRTSSRTAGTTRVPDLEAAPESATPSDVPGLLEVEGLDVGYRGTEWVVRGVDLRLQAGELLGLVGPSGCGKTTLLRGILGLAPERRGRIRLDGAEVGSDRTARLAFRSRVQGVWQDALGALDPRLTVARALDEALRVRDPGGPVEERMSRAKELLGRVGLEGDLLVRRPGELSGGQRQRVGLARALAVEPEILLLDEPVSALDAPARSGIMELISGLLRDSGAAGILCAHDLGVVARRCDRVVVMADGRIVEEGAVADLVARPRHPLTAALAALVGDR